MSKKYKLIQTLLMPGMVSIILPVGYEVELRDDRYYGEGGWYFGKHGVENNKLHWEEVKENGWEILELVHPIGTKYDNSDEPMFQQLVARIGKYESNWKINSVRRMQDGEVFTIGDTVTWGVDLDNKFTTTITGFEVEGSGLMILTSDSRQRPIFLDAPNFRKLPSQLKQPEPESSAVFGVTLEWKILSHPRDLGEVMDARDIRFIGTNAQCQDFITKSVGYWKEQWRKAAIDKNEEIAKVEAHWEGAKKELLEAIELWKNKFFKH